MLGNPRFVLASSDVQHTRCLLTAAEGWPELPAVVEARLRSALRVIAHSDLVIIGGGPLMEDSTAMAGWLRKVRLAKFVRKPVVVYGCGVGPFHSAEAARDIVRICEQASLVILRDDPSAALLTQAGYSGKAHIAADPSIAYLEKRLGEPARTMPDHSGPPRIGVSLRPWHGAYADTSGNAPGGRRIEARLAAAISQWCLHVQKRCGAEIVFYCFKHSLQEDDAELALAISEGLRGGASFTLRDKVTDPAALAREIGGLDAFLGTRFHSVVFATSRIVPTLAIDYDMKGGKCAAHMARLGQSAHCLSLSDLSAERLISAWDRLWTERARVRSQLADCRADLVSLANSNAQLTADLWTSLREKSRAGETPRRAQGVRAHGEQL